MTRHVQTREEFARWIKSCFRRRIEAVAHQGEDLVGEVWKNDGRWTWFYDADALPSALAAAKGKVAP
jgi:hypothetical protein